MRVFPQPYFDRPIYDQMENCPRGLRHSCSSTFLYLKRLFHEVLRTGDWERLPVANSLRKLRLENTKAGWNIVYPPPHTLQKFAVCTEKRKEFYKSSETFVWMLLILNVWYLYPMWETKVKGDGVSVILSSCPNISSLGYLVFAAAGN